jgi:hypothetical protein
MTSLDPIRIGPNFYLKKMTMLVICSCVHLLIKFGLHIHRCLACFLFKVLLVHVNLTIPFGFQVLSVQRIQDISKLFSSISTQPMYVQCKVQLSHIGSIPCALLAPQKRLGSVWAPFVKHEGL